MSAARLALVAAAGAAVLWLAKALAIGMAGGLDQSPVEGPLFLAGLVAALVGAVALGVALSEGRPRVLRAVAAAVVVVVLLAVVVAVSTLAAALQPSDPSWVWAEVNLWIAAVLLLAGAVVVWLGTSTTATHRARS